MILINEALKYSVPKDKSKDVLMFTANSSLTANRSLVMRDGDANTVLTLYPGIDVRLGAQIDKHCGSGGSYNVIWDKELGFWIGVLQIGTSHFRPPHLQLTIRSISVFKAVAEDRPFLNFHCPAPLGEGEFNWKKIEAILKELPDNVFIYKD